MLSDFAKNEIFMSCEYIKSHDLLPKKAQVFNIIGNSVLSDYLKNTIDSLNNKTEYRYTVYQSENADALSSTVSKQCFLYCFDSRTNDTYALIDLKKALNYAKNIKDAQFVALVTIPPLSARVDVQKLCEMEVSKIYTNSFLSEVEKELSIYCDKMTVKEIRFDNFLIENSDYNALNLSAIVSDAIDHNCVKINDSDAFNYVSSVSMSDAVNAVFTVLKHGKHANIYNMSGDMMSLYDAKTFVYKTLCKYCVKQNFINSDDADKKTYRVLSYGKLSSLGFAPVCDNETRLLYAMSDMLDKKYDIITDKIDSLYDGKLAYIRKAELQLLREVDKICRSNSIKYFLSGGTMLGAVRHKGFIPWDDDIDIAMLREDFERFRVIAKEQLPKEYQYQSHRNCDGYHYFFDKITIKDTYFSTKYSDKFDMLKGISMDIFVFDKTSDNKFMSKLHYKTLMALRLMMNVRWINHPRKNKSYLLSKVMLPILRLFSMDTYSKWYDKVLRRYEKRSTATVLPPATDHKWRGVMPIKWFENVVDAPFEDVMSYLPSGYDNYLRQWYGEDYNNLLPLCKRVGSHDFYRLDIGNCIDTIEQSTETQHFDYKGELL